MKKNIIFVFILLAFGLIIKAEVIPFPDLMRPHAICVDENRVYISDMRTILIYSIKDFTLLAKFGKKGEGPGEFMGWPFIRVTDNFILVEDPGRVLWFSKDGKYIKERKIPRSIRPMPIKDHFLAINYVFDDKAGKESRNIEIFDKDFNRKKIIYKRFVRNFQTESKVIKKDYQMVTPYFAVDTDGENIYIADSSKGFYIDVFSAAGDHLYTIKKNMEKIKFTQEYKDKLMEREKTSKLWLENKRNFNYVFPEFFPAMRSFMITGKYIFVATFKKKNDKSECILLDHKGKMLNKIWLTVEQPYIYTIDNNKFYCIAENIEKEEYELHITPLNLNPLPDSER